MFHDSLPLKNVKKKRHFFQGPIFGQTPDPGADQSRPGSDPFLRVPNML